MWWRRRQCVKSTASDQRQRWQVATLAPQAVVAQAASTQRYLTGIVLQRQHQQRVEQQQQPQRAQSRGRSRRSRRSSSDRRQCVNESGRCASSAWRREEAACAAGSGSRQQMCVWTGRGGCGCSGAEPPGARSIPPSPQHSRAAVARMDSRLREGRVWARAQRTGDADAPQHEHATRMAMR